MPSPNKVVLLHVPKTGGLRVREAIWQNLPEGAKVLIREDIDKLVFDAMTREELQKYTLISGHFGFAQLERIGGGYKRVVFLRDPVERFKAIYFHWRGRDMKGPLAEEARKLDIYRFAQSDHGAVVDFTNNAMTWQLAGQHFRRNGSFYADIDPHKLQRMALAHLGTFDVVGLRDRMNESFQILKAKLTWTFNADPAKSSDDQDEKAYQDVDDDQLREALGKRLTMDFALYENAKRLFRRHLAELPPQTLPQDAAEDKSAGQTPPPAR